ncbi:hypothetical protein QE414_001941 [Microbacterium sp. SORGH_AS 344]|nr:hypothetical protein [Microbacterium sp. SORGH_AS_0344]
MVGEPRYRWRVSTPRDDDALSWGGDDDPTLDVGDKHAPGGGAGRAPEPEPLQPSPPPAAPPARHPDPSDVPAEPDQDAAHAAPLGNAGLVGIGMVAMALVIFAIGWFVAGLQLQGLGLPIPSVTLIALTIGAALAPLVWFVAVLVLTRSWRTWQRFLLLILGIVLLVPWPFLSLGAFA